MWRVVVVWGAEGVMVGGRGVWVVFGRREGERAGQDCVCGRDAGEVDGAMRVVCVSGSCTYNIQALQGDL